MFMKARAAARLGEAALEDFSLQVSRGPQKMQIAADFWKSALGSGLINHNQKMTVAAIAMADMNVWAQRS